MTKERFERERKRLVEYLKASNYIKSAAVERAFMAVPRELFVPEDVRPQAYVDSPLPIGHMQTISAPSMIAIMLEALDIKEGQKVLEIGAGSGYHAALVSYIVGPKGVVYSVERIPELAEYAERNLREAGMRGRVVVVVGDGSEGYPPCAPYHRIYLTCASPSTPKHLLPQLTDGGLILAPVGRTRWWQDLIRLRRDDKDIKEENLGGCVFVPMIGKYGFRG